MSQAMNMFMDSYLRTKRPEFGNYDADQSFGANLVHGSEKQNPNANRNQDNAKFGIFGGQNKPVQGPMAGLPQMPMAQSIAPTNTSAPSFNMAGVVVPHTSNFLAGSGMDYLKKLFTPTVNKPVEDSVSRVMENMLSGNTSMTGTEQAVSRFLEGTPVRSGVEEAVERLGDSAIGSGITATSLASSFDPTSMGLAMLPGLTSRVTGSNLAGEGVGAAANVGMAAAQGFANPVSDVAALMSLMRFGSRLFG